MKWEVTFIFPDGSREFQTFKSKPTFRVDKPVRLKKQDWLIKEIDCDEKNQEVTIKVNQ
jgi:hypothetical protein